MTKSIMIALLTVQIGCRSSGESRVQGGTASQAQIVADGIQVFAESFSIDIDISSVKIRSMRTGAGKYNTVTRAIVLEGEVTDEQLAHNLRHELCHAVDLQSGFDSASSNAWMPSSKSARTTRINRREGFARLCAAGPVSLGAVKACGGSALEFEIARSQRELLDPSLVAGDLTIDWQVAVTIPPGDTVHWVGATGTDLVIASAEFDTYSWLIDGTLPPPNHPFSPLLELSPRISRSLGINTSVGWQLVGPLVELSEGDLTRATWSTPMGVELEQILLVENGAVLNSGCVAVDDQIFYTSDGRPWIARQEGQTLRWGPLIRQ